MPTEAAAETGRWTTCHWHVAAPEGEPSLASPFGGAGARWAPFCDRSQLPLRSALNGRHRRPAPEPAGETVSSLQAMTERAALKKGGLSKGGGIASPFGIRLYNFLPLPCRWAILFCTVSAWEGAGGGHRKASLQAGGTVGIGRLWNACLKSWSAKRRGIFTASPATDPRAGARAGRRGGGGSQESGPRGWREGQELSVSRPQNRKKPTLCRWAFSF